MGDTLREQVERFVGTLHDESHFRNVRMGTLLSVFERGGHVLMPDLDPLLSYGAVAAFVRDMVGEIGMGLIIRVVEPRDERTWQEYYRVTVFHDVVADEYVVQIFEKHEILSVSRIGRSSILWGTAPGEPCGRESAVLGGFLMGVLRDVPPPAVEQRVSAAALEAFLSPDGEPLSELPPAAPEKANPPPLDTREYGSFPEDVPMLP